MLTPPSPITSRLLVDAFMRSPYERSNVLCSRALVVRKKRKMVHNTFCQAIRNAAVHTLCGTVSYAIWALNLPKVNALRPPKILFSSSSSFLLFMIKHKTGKKTNFKIGIHIHTMPSTMHVYINYEMPPEPKLWWTIRAAEEYIVGQCDEK